MAVKFGANNVLIQRLQKLQEKAVCLINFETNTNVVGWLLKDSNILKLTDFIKYNIIRKENIHSNIMNFTISLTRIMSITQGDQQIRC